MGRPNGRTTMRAPIGGNESMNDQDQPNILDPTHPMGRCSTDRSEMMTSTRPPGPVAFLYARLSYEESLQRCAKCSKEWQHTRGTMATCPQCGHVSRIDLPNSVDRQTDRMRHWCKAKWSEEARPTLVEVPELGTGFKPFSQRPQAQQILANSQKGDFLVICKIDRGWRNCHDFHRTVNELERRGVTLMVVEEQFDTSTAMGRFMVSLSAALAQLERDRTSERTKAQIQWRKERGLCSGNHVKFGSKVTICPTTGLKVVVDDENELRMAKWIYEMRFVNQVPWDTLVIAAVQLGFRNRAGKPFNYNKLRDMGTEARKLFLAGKLDRVRLQSR